MARRSRSPVQSSAAAILRGRSGGRASRHNGGECLANSRKRRVPFQSDYAVSMNLRRQAPYRHYQPVPKPVRPLPPMMARSGPPVWCVCLRYGVYA